MLKSFARTVRRGKVFVAIAVVALAGSVPAKAQTPAIPPQPPLGLDHVIIYTQTGAPERKALEKAGFTIAPTVNRHDGQGTASVTVEFLNGDIELLYVDPGVPSAPNLEGMLANMQGRADFDTTGFSPFGLQLHRTATAPPEFPFPTTKVHADWMGKDENLELLTPRDRAFVTSLSVPPHAVDEAANTELAADPIKGAMFHHANGTQRITGVKIISPDPRGQSPAAAYVEQSGAATFEVTNEWRMILTLDGGRQGKVKDLNPALPLEIRY